MKIVIILLLAVSLVSMTTKSAFSLTFEEKDAVYDAIKKEIDQVWSNKESYKLFLVFQDAITAIFTDKSQAYRMGKHSLPLDIVFVSYAGRCVHDKKPAVCSYDRSIIEDLELRFAREIFYTPFKDVDFTDYEKYIIEACETKKEGCRRKYDMKGPFVKKASEHAEMILEYLIQKAEYKKERKKDKRQRKQRKRRQRGAAA